MMSAAPIAFLDSGIGGLPYFGAASASLPDHSLVYYADTRHFPYGQQSAESLNSITEEAVRTIIERWTPCLVVVACNTASVVALDSLRRRFDVPFVGVVPAVKPASERTRSGAIGLLATERTVADPYVSRLIRQYAPAHTVHMIAAGGLVEAIEAGEFLADGTIDERYLRGAVESLIEADVESVVLGCTHFVHVRSQIERLLGPGISVVDSVDGVVRQIVRVATARRCGSGGPDVRRELVCSGATPDSYYVLADRYGYRIPGSTPTERDG